jgi:tetratricopeptide (TPR) repeat protein
MDAAELIAIIRAAPSLRWVLLGQPWPAKAAIEAEFGIEAQTLHGWSLHEIAKEFSDHGCQISPSQAERIRHVTGGLPLFVQSSAKMVHDHYDGDAEKFIRAIENLTHPRTTGQEVILRQVQDKLPTEASQVASLLSIPDIALAVSDAKFFTAGALDLAEPRISAAIRELTDWGIVETLRDGRLAMHDAFRVLAQQAQATLRQDIVIKAKNLLVTKLMKGHGIAVFRLLCRLLPEIGQMDALVDVASDTSEYFHEFGMSQEFERVLLDAVHSDGLTPGDKFWALDTIIFWKVQSREDDEAEKYLKEAEALVEKFGPNERQIEALALKQLILAGHRGQIDLLKEIFERAVALSPEDKSFHRVLRYNYAACLYSLKEYDVAKSLIFPLIKEYFELLGLKPEDVTFKNQSEIFSKLKKTAFETDDLKHLADSLDLHASIMEGLNIPSPLARIHAFKFYAMANALTSAIKAGAKVVDEFLNMGDPVGARHFMESAMLQVFSEGRALDYFVPVHSQYAVVLAYCGEIDRAKTTMDELRPFLAASPEWQSDFEDQQRSIERIGAGLISLPQFGPPQSDPILRKSKRVKIGRNDLCPCGSGKKFKRCCGR